jgi:hypothetical protein
MRDLDDQISDLRQTIAVAEAEVSELREALVWLEGKRDLRDLPEPEPMAPSLTHQRRPHAETVRLIRGWAIEQGSRFWPADELRIALGYKTRNPGPMMTAIRELIEAGAIETNGTPDRSSQRRYRYTGKPEPSPNGTGPDRTDVAVAMSAPVPGTGKAHQPTTSKDTAKVIARARARGWRIEPASGAGKDRLVHPDAGAVTLARTPSDHRSARNLESTLRRMERAGAAA